MPQYLLDTNALSRLARGVDPGLTKRISTRLDDCYISAISWFELEYGAARSVTASRVRERLAYLRQAFPVILSFGETESAEAASIWAELETMKPNAQPIGPYDVLLAGHARALGAVFVTANVREFQRVRGITVENWEGGSTPAG